MNTGADHAALSLMFQTLENVQAFTTVYTFIPNGQNVSFVVTNDNFCSGGTCFIGANFSSGAGCEGGFFQAFVPGNPLVNNTAALMFDSYGGETAGSSTFTYSNTQLYQMNQSPCNANDSGPNYWGTNKISTSPVALNSPSTTVNTTTGHTYSATVSYDGSNLNECLIDVTAANGTCNGTGTGGTGTFFQQTWANVDIPAMVNGNTAYLGLVAATGTIVPPSALFITGWTYTVGTPPSFPSLSTYTTQTYAGASHAASVTFSPAAGSYSGTQSVTLTSSTSGANICYVLATPSSTLILPWPNGQAGCQNGTPYTGPVTVASTQTLYAIAGTTYVGLPSAHTSAAYTIGGGGTPTASTPTFSPVAGTYTGAQNVTISTSTGPAICYNFTGSPATNGVLGCAAGSTLYSSAVMVSAAETLYAVSGGSGFNDSAVGSAVYSITNTSVLPFTSELQLESTSGASPTAVLSDNVFLGGASAPVSYGLGLEVWGAGASGQGNLFQGGNGSSTCSGAATGNCSGWNLVLGVPNTNQNWTNNYFSGTDVWGGTANNTTNAITYDNGATSGASGLAVAPNTVVQTSAAQTVTGPTISPAAGTYTGNVTVSITDSDVLHGLTFFYTIDGSTPSSFGPGGSAGTTKVYSTPFSVPAGTTVNAIAAWGQGANQGLPFPSFGWLPSGVTSVVYGGTSTPVSTPTFTPDSENITTATSVSIATATVQATIYYTIDGSSPTTSSTMYTGPITVSTTTTINAIGVKSGMTTSAIGVATYSAGSGGVATPVFSPSSTNFSSTQTVSVADSTGSSTIYCTTDGSPPDPGATDSTAVVYSAPFTFTKTTQLQCMAEAAGLTNSFFAQATYTLTNSSVTPPVTGGSQGNISSNQIVPADKQGNGVAFQMDGGGTHKVGNAVVYDAFGNTIDSNVNLTGGGGIAPVYLTLNPGSIGANTCTTATTTSMPGTKAPVPSTSTPGTTYSTSWASDPETVVGWGKVGGVVWEAWPTTDTLNWKICNQTSVAITGIGSIGLSVGAK